MEENEKDVTITEIIDNLKIWLNFLKTKLYLILLVALLSSIIAYLYVYFDNKNPKFIAKVNFVIEEEKNTIGGAIGLAAQLGLDGGSGSNMFSALNLMEMMKSESLIEKTLINKIEIDGKVTTLADFYTDFKGWRTKEDTFFFKNVEDREKMSREQNSYLAGIYFSIIRENLTIGQNDKKTSFYQVNVASESENFSKYFAEQLVAQASRLYIETKVSKTSKNVNILQKQVDSVRSELNKAITGVAKSNDNTFNLNPALRINMVPSTQSQIDVQANTAMLTELIKNLEMSRMSLMKEIPLIQVIDKPRFPLATNRKSPLKYIGISFLLSTILSAVYLILRKQFTK